MVDQQGINKKHQRGHIKRQERADRILDAARELILRYGYKKTTIDDIARQAGVAKGTIYLHWKSREELFFNLVVREKITLGEEIQQQMVADPEGFSLFTLVKYSLLAYARYPLIKALVLQDQGVLGDLTALAQQDSVVQEQYAAFEAMLTNLREQQVIRTDQPLKEQIGIVYAIISGFLTYKQYMLPSDSLSDEENARVAAEALRRILAVRPADQSTQDRTRRQYEQMIKETKQYLAKKEHMDE